MHRANTVVSDLMLHQVNRTNKCRNEYYNRTIDVRGGGTVRPITEYRCRD